MIGLYSRAKDNARARRRRALEFLFGTIILFGETAIREMSSRCAVPSHWTPPARVAGGLPPTRSVARI